MTTPIGKGSVLASFKATVLASLLVVSLAGALANGQNDVPSRVAIPIDMPWANLAWGFESGGQDNVTGTRLVLVDLFDEANETIQEYRNMGKIVACYFSGGTLEDWRPDVLANLSAWTAVVAGSMADWEDEAWLDITKLDELKELMTPRFELAVSKGCQAIEVDNVDCYDNEDCYSGTSLANSNLRTRRTAQIAYNEWQTNISHTLGLSIGLKNALDLISYIGSEYDFAINEQCAEYDECDTLSDFINDGKAVLNVEYNTESATTQCSDAQSLNIMRKMCDHMTDDDGLCKSNQTWIDCFALNYTNAPTQSPTLLPTLAPSTAPTNAPSSSPTVSPTSYSESSAFVDKYVDWALLLDDSRGNEDDLNQLSYVVGSLRNEDLESLIAQGHKVICSFSAGTYDGSNADETSFVVEDVFLADASESASVQWLDISQLAALKILMNTRLQSAADKGCYAVLFEDLNCIDNDACLNALDDALSKSESCARRQLQASSASSDARNAQVQYAQWLAVRSNQLGMPAGISQGASIIDDLEDYIAFAFTVNCESDNDCSAYTNFTDSGKPILNLEIYDTATSIPNCTSATSSEDIFTKRCVGNVTTEECNVGSSFSNCFIGSDDFSTPAPTVPTRAPTAGQTPQGPDGSPSTPEDDDGNETVPSGYFVATWVLFAIVIILLTIIALLLYRMFCKKEFISESHYIPTRRPSSTQQAKPESASDAPEYPSQKCTVVEQT